MSLLNPGGLRTAPFGRIFGHDNIRRALQQVSADHRHKARGSIATEPHYHEREIARRRRQQGIAV